MLTSLPQGVLFVMAGIIGALLGSFANVCIVRLPREQSIVSPRSHCFGCGHSLAWWENIPIASFLILKGRCRQCGMRIALRYPTVEALCAILALVTWWFFRHPLPFFLSFVLLIVPLVIVTFIDLEHHIIPNEISLPGIIVGIGVHMLLAPPGGTVGALIDSVLGIVGGGLSLFLVAAAYEKLKGQEGLGGGDVKLIAMLGAFFGWKAVILILLVSSILGSLVGITIVLILRKDLKYAIPFGPFLAAAGLIQLFIGERLVSWYLHLFM